MMLGGRAARRADQAWSPVTSRARPAPASAKGRRNLDFTLKDMNGADRASSPTYKGKVDPPELLGDVVRRPARRRFPSSSSSTTNTRTRASSILGVSVDDDEPDAARLRVEAEDELSAAARDQDELEDAYGPSSGCPTSFFIGRDGSVCSGTSGRSTKEQLEREIKSLL